MASRKEYQNAVLRLLICIIWLVPGFLKAGPKFPVSAIPDTLRSGVDAVMREDRRLFKILSRSSAIEQTYKAITILNAKGKGFASEVIGYDKLLKIKNLSASIYDGNGNLIRKLKNSEIHDQSAYDGFSLYSDNRLKHFEIEREEYPYTVEVEYEMEYQFLFYMPTFTVLQGARMSSQFAEFALAYPAELKDLRPRFSVSNVDQTPKETTIAGVTYLTWTFRDVRPVSRESFGPPAIESEPYILSAPSHFEFAGYQGAMSTWIEFGKWIGSLNKGRDVLSNATRQKILDITADKKTIEEKARVIYEYMQNKTRYVSIQLGIGGFQPFEASVVDDVGYGDCKALSNYMVSLLAVAGIKANYVLIRAGKDTRPINANFPSSQFNHAVAFVPNAADTIWLECTSQSNPFGYMGTFTGDRKALAITDDGAQIVWTPKYRASQNVQKRIADVLVDIQGNASAKVKTTYSGLQYETGHLNFILDNQYDDQKKWIQENTNIPSFDLNAFSITTRKSRIPSVIVKSDLTLNKLASVSGKRIFLKANLLSRSTFVPAKIENRKTKIITHSGYTELDTISYHVPEEIYPEYLPEPTVIKSLFGEYETHFLLNQGSVIYVRKLVVNKGEFPAASYNEMVEFYKKLNQADNIKLVFLKKT